MTREDIEAQVEALAEPIAAACGVELVDVAYLSENGRWILRVSIDREGGVTLDDCQRVSEILSDELDRVDPIPGSYSVLRHPTLHHFGVAPALAISAQIA